MFYKSDEIKYKVLKHYIDKVTLMVDNRKVTFRKSDVNIIKR
ncbi:MAG: hypothetical protein ACOC3Z_01630 [Nanoarchaeota archaeon]